MRFFTCHRLAALAAMLIIHNQLNGRFLRKRLLLPFKGQAPHLYFQEKKRHESINRT